MKKAYYERREGSYRLSKSPTLTGFPHLHKEIELIFVKSGKTMVHADNFSATIYENDLFISFPNQIHYYEYTVQGDYMVIIVSPDVFFDLKNEFLSKIPINNVISLAADKELLQLMINVETASGRYAKTVAVGYLNILFASIIDKMAYKKTIISENSTLKRVLEYCNENFTGDINLSTAEQSVYLTKYYISRLMKQHLGMGFTEYVQMQRLNYACDLLRNTNDKIADISENVGFGTIRSFDRAFKKCYGLTPIEYRSKYV